MASMMIHLEAAHRLLQPGGLLAGLIVSPAQFYLGVTAPDSVNLNGFAPKHLRWDAHLRAKPISEWYQRIRTFYRAQQETAAKKDPDLLLGYVVHTVTDAAFDETLHDAIWASAEKNDRLDSKIKGEFEPGWIECFRYDFSQREKNWWKVDVKPALERSVSKKINIIPAELMDRYRLYILGAHWDTLDRESPRVITREIVWLLADYVEKQCRRALR